MIKGTESSMPTDPSNQPNRLITRDNQNRKNLSELRLGMSFRPKDNNCQLGVQFYGEIQLVEEKNAWVYRVRYDYFFSVAGTLHVPMQAIPLNVSRISPNILIFSKK